MKEYRKTIRIRPKEFEEYRVRIDLDELTLDGSLGNVSESGLCVIMTDESLVDEVGSAVSGAIFSRYRPEVVDFFGKVVWTQEHKKEQVIQYLSGIEFDEPVQLSNPLLLKSITAEE